MLRLDERPSARRPVRRRVSVLATDTGVDLVPDADKVVRVLAAFGLVHADNLGIGRHSEVHPRDPVDQVAQDQTDDGRVCG